VAKSDSGIMAVKPFAVSTLAAIIEDAVARRVLRAVIDARPPVRGAHQH
jgi:hypothetical protein